MQHLDEGTIHSWLDGALSADEAARVELHVASCETCSDVVAEARGLIAASSRILTALDDVPRVGARRERGARGGRGVSVARWRIAAVIAAVVGGGALALAVRRDAIVPVALEQRADRGSELAFVVADSPTAEAEGAPNVPPQRASRDAASDGRGAIGAAFGSGPTSARARERDLRSAAQAESAAPTLAQLDVSAPAAPPPAPTNDTVQLPVAVAQANRVAPQAGQVEDRSSMAEKLSGALGARRSVAEAPARFAEPVAPQARLRATAEEGQAPVPLSEERSVEGDGRVVVRRVYRVEETLVTLDERAPREREEQQAEREQVKRVEERLRRLEPAAEGAARADTLAVRITTIRWVDARGAEFTLSGAAPQAQLERIRKLLGH